MNSTTQTSAGRETNFRNAEIAELYECLPDPRGFFESVLGFSGLGDSYIRVSYADQRRYFGRVIFGKCAVMVSESGVVRIIKTKAFGRDFDKLDMFFDHLCGQFRSVFGDNDICHNPSHV